MSETQPQKESYPEFMRNALAELNSQLALHDLGVDVTQIEDIYLIEIVEGTIVPNEMRSLLAGLISRDVKFRYDEIRGEIYIEPKSHKRN